MLRSRSGVLDIYLLEAVRAIHLITGQIVIVIKPRGGRGKSALGPHMMIFHSNYTVLIDIATSAFKLFRIHMIISSLFLAYMPSYHGKHG